MFCVMMCIMHVSKTKQNTELLYDYCILDIVSTSSKTAQLIT